METGRRVLAEMALPDCSKFKGRARSPSPSLSLTLTRGVSKESPPPLSFSFFLLATTTHLPSRLSSLWLDHNATSKGLSRSACCAPLSVFLLHPFAFQGRGEGQSRRDANSSLFSFFSYAIASLSLSFFRKFVALSLLARALSCFFPLSLFFSRPSLSCVNANELVYRAGNQLEIRR